MHKNTIVNDILSHPLTKDAINNAKKSNKTTGWVFDEIECLIELIDDCTEEGSLIFDKLEDSIYFLIRNQ